MIKNLIYVFRKYTRPETLLWDYIILEETKVNEFLWRNFQNPFIK